MTLSRAAELENAGIVEKLIHVDLFQDNLGSMLAVRTRAILVAVVKRRDPGHDERYYKEAEYERRVRKRKR